MFRIKNLAVIIVTASVLSFGGVAIAESSGEGDSGHNGPSIEFVGQGGNARANARARVSNSGNSNVHVDNENDNHNTNNNTNRNRNSNTNVGVNLQKGTVTNVGPQVELNQVYEAQERDPVSSAYSSANSRYECIVGIGAGVQGTGLGISISGGYESTLCNLGYVAKFIPKTDARYGKIVNAMYEISMKDAGYDVSSDEGMVTRSESKPEWEAPEDRR